MVFNRMLKMNVSIRLPSRIFKILKILKTLKIINKKLFKKTNFQKTGMYVKELCKVYMCTKFQVDVLKNDQVLVF